MQRTVPLVTHPACARHDPGPDHAEAPSRLVALERAVRADPELWAALSEVEGVPASEADLLRVHTPGYVARVRAAAEQAAREGDRVSLEADTVVGAASFEAALAAAGCAVGAAERALDGSAAFALSRPPGHHAMPDRAMGFCLFNNVAVAVRRLQAEGRVRDVLVVDWDAHHGNGTQEIFYKDPSVYLISLHLGRDYPGTGNPAQRGAGPGRGLTRNVPLPHGTGAAEYRRRYCRALDAALAAFSPELVVVSAGFDLLSGDPEGGFLLEPRDLHALTTDLLERLPARTRGVAAVLEGGYALERIGAGLVEVLRALAGLPLAPDPPLLGEIAPSRPS